MNRVKNKKYFVNFIIGYFPALHNFAPYQNYYLYPSLLAEEMGYQSVIIIKSGDEFLESDPNRTPGIQVIVYKNVFQFLSLLVKYVSLRSVFYVNNHSSLSYGMLVFTKMFFCKNIFMGHIQPKRTSRIRQFIFDLALFFTTRIRLNNDEEKKFLVKRGFQAKKLFVVPIALNDKVFFQSNFDYSKRNDVLYYGNMTKQKGLPTIFEAFHLLKQKLPESKLHLVGSYGDYDPAADIERFGLSSSVIFHGAQKHGQKLRDILNQTRVFVISTKAEGQCMAVYEAALTGNALCLPQIISFRSSFKDKALFHELGDAKKLSENMYTYLIDTEKIKRDTELCQKMIHSDYREDAVKESFQKLLTF